MSHEPHDKLDQPRSHRLVPVTAGRWSGWYHYEPADPFEDYTGPFYCREDAQGLVCGFLPEAKNANAGGNIHGGALMVFADYALFMLAGGMDAAIHGVTMTCNSDFTGAAEVGRLLTARGEVIREGASIVFLRGLISDGDRPVLAFSGTIKKFKPRG
jgi:acyl-coenzyme A thioesterase PaaI-like protein